MERSRSAVAMLAVLAGLAGAASAQTMPHEPPAGFAERITAFAQGVRELHEVPGLAIAVTRGDEVVYARAFGVANVDTGARIGPDSLFHMASVSKPFVATAVLQLVERGQVDLDAPVTTYLPYFKLNDPRSAQITVRQMLNHTSGMPDVQDYEWANPQYDEGAAERYVRSLADRKLVFTPGERFRYSNMAYDVLGDLIAKVSGEPFEVYVKRNILDPIGMTASTFLYPETNESLRTSGHIWDVGTKASEVYPYNRPHAPSSTLNSSVQEMTSWMLVNLNRGELNGARILEDPSYELLWTPSVQAGANTSIGLGWFLARYEGRRVVTHGGGDLGFRSYVALLPEDDLGVVLAGNYSRTPMRAVLNGVLDILFGGEPTMPKRSIGFVFAETMFSEDLDAATAQYLQLKAEAADRYEFNARELNQLGYVLLQRGMFGPAAHVLRFNVEQYPDVANCWDSLGEAFSRMGKPDDAIHCYRKALELDPTFESARKKLQALESES
jgi:CubicO group peptidase (beta-lactamase class C family)